MRYAAYGSNLHPLRLGDRLSSARLVETSFLSDWSLRFHKRSLDKSGKCNIVSGGSGIHIAIFDISRTDRTLLDRIEGLGFGYTQISLAIPEVGECMSYAAEDSYIDDSLTPYDWYKELVLLGAREHSFPTEYLDDIERINAIKDPDPRRNAVRWKTIDMIRAGD